MCEIEIKGSRPQPLEVSLRWFVRFTHRAIGLDTNAPLAARSFRPPGLPHGGQANMRILMSMRVTFWE